MAQGAAHIPAALGSPAKASPPNAGTRAPAPSSGTIDVARPQSAPTVAAKPAAPAAPKAQRRPAPATNPIANAPASPGAAAPVKPLAAAPTRPAAVAPAPPVQKPALAPVDNSDAMDTRVGPSPIAAVKPLQGPLLSQHDVRPVVRALIDASVAPLEQALRDLQRRIEDLERRPAPMHAPAPAHAPGPVPAAPRAPVLDIATIERTVTLGPEAESFSGARRRRRLVLGTVLGIVIVFGGLFAALAQSYTHAHG